MAALCGRGGAGRDGDVVVSDRGWLRVDGPLIVALTDLGFSIGFFLLVKSSPRRVFLLMKIITPAPRTMRRATRMPTVRVPLFANLMGPLSTLPPKPALSQKGGAQ